MIDAVSTRASTRRDSTSARNVAASTSARDAASTSARNDAASVEAEWMPIPRLPRVPKVDDCASSVDSRVMCKLFDLQVGSLRDQQKCGIVAATVLFEFTAKSAQALNDNRRNQWPKTFNPAQFTAPKSGGKAVMLTFSSNTIDHTLVLIITPSGTAHSLQAFAPTVNRPYYFSRDIRSVRKAIDVLFVKERWDKEYSDAFATLTSLCQVQRHMGLRDGVFMHPTQVDGAEQVGRSLLAGRARMMTTVVPPKLSVVDFVI